ncbi:Uu.00g131400.m01.CDS01 [Anthostomella pinea]|uniref:Uu.00g131400.m01.CDS01 n=1 Tax=Anthostomella pinea TaxID=933095 RepID=A0AAI8YIA0_9PEZI|nr:Uu.00g131400.m01.CDS01 [Anthostomella pinea]
MTTVPTDSYANRPLARLFIKPYIRFAPVIFIAASCFIFGVAIVLNQKSPVRTDKSCQNQNDPVFWETLGQVLLRVLLVVCILRAYEEPVHERVLKPIFYSAVGLAVFFDILALVLYSTVCGGNGWLANLLLQWGGSVAAVLAAFMLATYKDGP